MQDRGRLSGGPSDDLHVEQALRIDADDERDGPKEEVATKDRAIKVVLADCATWIRSTEGSRRSR